MPDDDITSPEIFGADEPTNPGIGGTNEAFDAIDTLRNRALEAYAKLASTCPKVGEPGRERHLEVLINAQGEIGMLWWDLRRITSRLKREEFGK